MFVCLSILLPKISLGCIFWPEWRTSDIFFNYYYIFIYWHKVLFHSLYNFYNRPLNTSTLIIVTLFISSDLHYDAFCPVFENHFQTLYQVINVTFAVHLISFSCHGYLTFAFRLIIFQVTRLAKDNYVSFLLFMLTYYLGNIWFLLRYLSAKRYANYRFVLKLSFRSFLIFTNLWTFATL